MHTQTHHIHKCLFLYFGGPEQKKITKMFLVSHTQYNNTNSHTKKIETLVVSLLDRCRHFQRASFKKDVPSWASAWWRTVCSTNLALLSFSPHQSNTKLMIQMLQSKKKIKLQKQNKTKMNRKMENILLCCMKSNKENKKKIQEN